MNPKIFVLSVLVIAVLVSSGCVSNVKTPQQETFNCSDASFIIKNGWYEDHGDMKDLTLSIWNTGRKDLTFDVRLKYTNNIEIRESVKKITPSEYIGTIYLADVDEDLQRVTVMVKECPGLIDWLNRENIPGLE